MSTESHIEARDAKAAGGVVAEGREQWGRVAYEGYRSWAEYPKLPWEGLYEDVREDWRCTGDAILDALTAAQAREHDAPMTDVQVKHMVERFLRWRLPDDFHPDNGISFKPTFNEHLERPTRHEPTGTNLFVATQADAMVRHMVEGLPPYTFPDTNADGAAEREVGRFIYRRIEKLMGAKAGTSEGDELDYLAQIVSDVEEYGATGDEVMASFTAAQAREAGLREALAHHEGKRAPVQGFKAGIPWDMHLQAYDVYSAKWAPQPAMIDLEGRNCRGGFSIKELDMFIPGWRDELQRRGDIARAALSAPPPRPRP